MPVLQMRKLRFRTDDSLAQQPIASKKQSWNLYPGSLISDSGDNSCMYMCVSVCAHVCVYVKYALILP